jgi:sugar phosphate isomerase/epimerase
VTEISRKEFLGGSCALAGAALLSTRASGAKQNSPDNKKDYWFGYSLNMGTIRGQKLGLVGEIDVAAKAGYDGIEPWIGTISKYVESGGSLKDIRKRCEDSGLRVCSAIGFAQWVVDDEHIRAKGLEQLKRDMDLLAKIGGTHIAAPPAGASRPGTTLDLNKAAERYHRILDIGRNTGVIPQVETWGPSANLSHVAEAVYVAARAGHPDACVLADVYHMYKGGVEASALKLLGRQAVHCFHMNDYPADPPRDQIQDADRIWPGDGIAPMKEILSHLAGNGCRVMLSLELFNREYWKLPALEVAKTGLAKMKKAVSNIPGEPIAL